jgi:hypothetical protein
MLDGRPDLTHDPLNEELPTKRPTRIITYAWGERYVHELLSLTLPALLAPGNLPSVATSVPCELVLLTEERFFATVNAHASILRAKEFCPLRLIGLDDLITVKDKYGMALTHALHRGFSDLGPAMTDSWQIFLNADFILADGCLRNLLRHLARGTHLVASPSYCVAANEVTSELHRRIDKSTSTLSISPRELAALAIKHRHNTIRGKTVNERLFNINQMDQFYWLVDNNTLLGYQMPIAIVGMRPERYLAEVNSLWDYGLMREFCPEAEICVLGDSDEFLMIELRDKEVAEDQISLSWPGSRQIAERMMVFLTKYQREFAQFPLTLHASDLTAEVNEARAKLRAYIDEVLSYLPPFLPSHIGHPQWDYHLPRFIEARHKFLSDRLGSWTETTEPPPSLSKVDRIWWKLDATHKMFSRKLSQIQETKSQLLAFVRGEIAGVDNDMAKRRDTIYQEFAKELATIQNEFIRSGPDDVVGGFLGVNFAGNSTSLDTAVALMERYEEKLGQILDPMIKRKNELDQLIKRITNLYDQRLSRLESDYESKCQNLETEYQRLLQPRVLSAATPYVGLKRGPQAAGDVSSWPATGAPLSGGAISRLAAKIYGAAFGRLPRVTQLSCYWAPLRHVVRLVDTAAARGAKNVLVIGSGGGFIDTIADNLPGLHALVSMSDLKTGNLAIAFDRSPQFDLCICNLEFAELAEFSTIVSAVRPLMVNGGTIIGFYLNYNATSIIVDNILMNSMSHLREVAQFYFSGSPSSVLVIRKFQDAARSYHTGSPFVRSIIFLLRLLKIVPQALAANRTEAAIARKVLSASVTQPCTSVTIEVPVNAIS